MCGEFDSKRRRAVLLQKRNALGGPPPRAGTSTRDRVLLLGPGDENSQVVRGHMRHTKAAALTFPTAASGFSTSATSPARNRGQEVSSIQNSRPATNLRSTEAAEKAPVYRTRAAKKKGSPLRGSLDIFPHAVLRVT